MKKILPFIIFAAVTFLVSCSDKNVFPPYSTSPIFSVNSKMSHNADTVNIGDTVMLTAKGLIADTTNSFSPYFRVFSGSVSSSTGAFTSSGIQVGGVSMKPTTKTFSAPSGTSPLYNWTATFQTPVPAVAHKTNILITGYFENSLTLSSQTGAQISTDSKQIYVR